MEEHVLWVTKFVNHLLGPIALSLLHALHITPENPETPIPQQVVMSLLVVIAAVVLVWLWLHLWQLLMVIAVAVVVAIGLEPIVEWLQRRRMPRPS